MTQLAYLSTATSLLPPEEIERIMTASRSNNSKRGITGMLLYKGGNILQIIEGERAEVLQLFAVIQNDKRHHGVLKLYEKEVSARDFPEWTMGFQDLNAEGAKRLEGFTEFLRPDFDMMTMKPSAAAKLLKVFKSGVR